MSVSPRSRYYIFDASNHRESYIISKYGETIVIERKQDPNQNCTNITFYRSANFRWAIFMLGVYGICSEQMYAPVA